MIVLLTVDACGVVPVIFCLQSGPGALGGDDRGIVAHEVVVNQAGSAHVVLGMHTTHHH